MGNNHVHEVVVKLKHTMHYLSVSTGHANEEKLGYAGFRYFRYPWFVRAKKGCLFPVTLP